MSEQQLLLLLNETLDARRNLRSRGFVDRTSGYQNEFGSDVMFALCRESSAGAVSFLGLHNESIARRGGPPMGFRVICLESGVAPEIRDFLEFAEESPVAAAMRWIDELCSRLHLGDWKAA